jgi:hypothetical protein
MILIRATALILLAVAAELMIFRHLHRDLLYLQQPAAQIASDPQRRLQEYGARALSRKTLARRHVETIAQAAWQTGDTKLLYQAFQRLARDYPDDRRLRLRWAEALRLAGRHDEATAMYYDVLGWNR